MSKIKKNLGYQTAYQILATILPFITAPYLSRVLGAEQLGISSYTTSIAAYFVLFAMLGTVNYGTRSIASCKSDRKERSRVFWEIYTLQMIFSIASLLFYGLYYLFFCKENRMITMIQSLSILSCCADITWLFFGVENFKTTVTRNLVIKILSVASVLLFVKQPADTWLYILIMTGSTFLSQIVLWAKVKQYVDFVKPDPKQVMTHLKPNLLLFVPLLAMSVYHTMDKTMLGIMSDYTDSGFYYNADKIVNIPMGIISGFSTVLLPRMTAVTAEGNEEKSNHLFRISLEGTVLAGIAMACGIATIAPEFEPWFFGPGYEACILLTVVLAPVLILKAFSLSARYQYLIPRHLEKVFTISVLLGAGVNLIVNLLLIQPFGALGAVIGTLAAEAVACIWQMIVIWKMLDMKKTMLHCLYYMIFGIAMFGTVRLVSMIAAPTIMKLVLEIIAGASVYTGLCLLYWKLSRNEVGQIFAMPILTKIKRRR